VTGRLTVAGVLINLMLVAYLVALGHGQIGSRSGPLRDATVAEDHRTLHDVSVQGRTALALVDYPWQRLGFRLLFAPSDAATPARVNLADKTITVFLTPDEVGQSAAHSIASASGRAYDLTRMDAAERRTYLLRRGVQSTAWGALEAEDFAEVFAACHARGSEFLSTVAPRPSHPCALLPRSARATVALSP
jgi:hypothetical protein